jgi:hypothetical protein
VKDDRFVLASDPLAVFVTQAQNVWKKDDVDFLQQERARLQAYYTYRAKTKKFTKRRASLVESSRSC